MEYSILPADRYKVINRTTLNDNDKNHLICLYAPIIGPLAVSLYLTLWQDINENSDQSDFLIHHHLMSILKCSSKVLKEARESLEAVGLVKTYVKEENVLEYIYELYSPLSPLEFLSHPILNVVLYNNIGRDEYEKILKKYKRKRYDYSTYTNITKQMDEVYRSENFGEAKDIQDRETADIKISSKINYDLIMESIPKDTLSEKALNKKMRELIDNLSFIYDVDTLRMVEFIRKSINEFGMIDKGVLKDTVRKYYELSSNSLPTIVYRTQPEYLKKAPGENTLRARAIAMFENNTPYDFLKAKNKGANPTAKELNLIEELIVDLELTPAVVNVLVDFCLRKNNNKLVKNYVETVASQWKRAGLKTAEEAMLFAEKEHKKTMKKATESEKEKTVEPVWFNNKIEKGEISKEDEAEINNLFKEFM